MIINNGKLAFTLSSVSGFDKVKSIEHDRISFSIKELSLDNGIISCTEPLFLPYEG